MHAIVLTFDRLALHLLGCYGSSWVETPHFDRLAAGAVVFDRHYAENLDPTAQSHAWWTGCRQFPTSPARRGEANVAAQLRQAGVSVHFIAEHGARRPDWATAGFESADEVGGYDGLDAEADEVPFARLVAAAVERFSEWPADPASPAHPDAPRLLWLKSRGVPSPWLAPRDWATLYLDLEDDETEAGADEPSIDEPDDDQSLGADAHDSPGGPLVDFSPEEFDALLRAVSSFGLPGSMAGEATETEWRIARQVYAGYLSLLDRWLGRLLAEIDEHFGQTPPLLIVTAAEGEVLGHRPGLPAKAGRLSEEIVHTPLLIRPGPAALGNRRQELAQTIDVPATLLDWFDVHPKGMPCEGRSLLPVISPSLTRRASLLRGERDAGHARIVLGDGPQIAAFRTSDLFLVRTAPSEPKGEPVVRLFAQPDDTWAINDVSAQSPAECARVVELLDGYIAAATRSAAVPVPDAAQPPAENSRGPESAS